MPRRLTLSGDALTQMMSVAHQLGGGQDLDAIFEIIARTVTDLLRFDAVAVNVRRDDGDLEVRAVTGPPEIQALRGGRMSESQWLDLLGSCERWGGLYFSRAPRLPAGVPVADPWDERLPGVPGALDDVPVAGFLPVEPWRAQFALLAPVWSEGLPEGRLHGVISIDLPRSGLTPDAEQQMLLELFAKQVGMAIDRLRDANDAADRISLYRAAFAESPLATALLDARLLLTDVNDAFLQLTDAVPRELDHRHLAELLAIDAAELAARLGRLAPGETTSPTEHRLGHPRGIAWERWVDVTARRVDDMSDEPRYVCTLTDRTEARNEMDEIRHRADHDALTGLSARPIWLDAVQDRLDSAVAGGPDVGQVVAILFCDLDGFKKVNDIAGHIAGDRTLVTVADLMRTTSDPHDRTCRWGGDEFAVVATRDSLTAVMDLGEDIASAITAMATSVPQGDPVAGVSISIGIAALDDPNRVTSTTELIELADTALYRAKNDPTRRIHIRVV